MIRHLVLALLLSELFVLGGSASDLAGRVVDDKGQPLAGASVFVNTAAPREGVAIFCPSCYLDCGRKATTGDDGRFTIDDLDPALVFYLVATADGHRARGSQKIDPAKDTAEIRLDPLPADLPPERVVRGRVVDEDGKPVVGAEVRPFGCRTGNRRWWGSLPGVDSVSITDNDGEFIITAKEPAEAYDLEVRSPRHAPRRFELKPTGEDGHELVVEAGAIVRGRVLRDGEPIEGVTVGLVQTDRSSETFLGETLIGTDQDGNYQFDYVPKDDFYVYTIMTSMKDGGALPLRRVSVGDSKTIVDVPDAELAPAHTLAGHIVLTDGKPVPGSLQMIISREGAWDSQRFMVGADGAFRFENVPHNEPVTIIARVPGYRLASERNRFQQVRENSIAMFVEGPRDEIEIYYEPSDAQP